MRSRPRGIIGIRFNKIKCIKLVKTSIINRFTKIRHIKLVKNSMRYLCTKIRQIQLDKISIKIGFLKLDTLNQLNL
jgi:hypothetical protein